MTRAPGSLLGMERSAWCPFGAALAVALTLAIPARAQSSGGCGAGFTDWLAACARATGVRMSPDHCDEGVAVLAAQTDGTELRVELSSAPGTRGLARAGGYALSPVGEFSDWSAAPAALHNAFDAVHRCARMRAPTFGTAEAHPALRAEAQGRMRAVLAWLALAAWVGLVAHLALRRRAARLDVALGLACSLVAAALRWAMVREAFFHQNGHGAAWVAMARCRPGAYGPGYTSVFHGASVLAGIHAERGVFALQLALSALAAGAVYALARGQHAPRVLALAIAFAVACDPLLARLARSESHFALILSLVLLAQAAFFIRRARHAPSWAGVAAGGVLAALAATVHPAGWIPAAMVPAVALCMPGARRRVRNRALLGALAAGVITAALAAPAMRSVLNGSLGQQWRADTPQDQRLAWLAALVLGPWVVALASPRRIARVSVPLAVVLCAWLADRATNQFGAGASTPPAQAWRMLYGAIALPALVTLLVRVVSAVRVRLRYAASVVAALVVACATIRALWTFHAATTLPTDALETREFGRALQALPAGTRVFFLGRTGNMVQELPLYADCGLPTAMAISLRSESTVPRLSVGDYWFRSSLCGSSSGRGYCDAIESQLVLAPQHTAQFPARPSLPYLPYAVPLIRSELYRVDAIRAP